MEQRNTRRQVIQIGSGLVLILTAGCLGEGDDQEPLDEPTAGDGDDADDGDPTGSHIDDGDDDDNGDDTDTPDGDTTEGDDDPADDEDEDDARLPAQPIPESELIDDFEDLSRWDVINGDWEANTDTVLTGSQSAEVSIDDESRRAAIRYSFRPPVDLRRRSPQLAVKTDETIRPYIQVVDIYGNRMDYRSMIRANMDFQLYDFGIDSVPDEFDPGAVETLRIVNSVGETETRELQFDTLRMAGRHDPGIVLLQFDDVVETQYTNAFPILDEQDMQATAMVNVGYIGRIVAGTKRTSVAQLDELYEAGWDIGNHGMYHLNLLDVDDDTIDREIREAHEWLADHGFERGAGYFCYPYALYDQHVVDTVAEDHDLAFTGGRPALPRLANRYVIQRALADPDAESAIETLDLTAGFGGLTVLFYHDISGDMEAEFETTIEYLAELREEGRLRVETVSDIEDEILDDSVE